MAAVIQLAYTQREPISYGAATVMALLIMALMTFKPVSIPQDPHEFLTSLESPQPQPVLPTPKFEQIPTKTVIPQVTVRPAAPMPVIKEASSQQSEMPVVESHPKLSQFLSFTR